MKKKIIASSIIGVIGIMTFIGFIIFSVLNISGGIQMNTPSQLIETLEEGQYTVFHEYKSYGNGQIIISSEEDLNGLKVVVTSKDGQNIELLPVKGNVTYNINNRSGRGIFTFDIPELDEYHISTESKNSVALNISQMTAMSIIKIVFTSFLILIVTAVLILIVLLNKAKNIDEDYDRYED